MNSVRIPAGHSETVKAYFDNAEGDIISISVSNVNMLDSRGLPEGFSGGDTVQIEFGDGEENADGNVQAQQTQEDTLLEGTGDYRGLEIKVSARGPQAVKVEYTNDTAGGYYIYKEVEKQKQLAEGETFEDDSDLFEDETPIRDGGDVDADAEIEIDGEGAEEAPSRFEEIKTKTSDVAHKVKDKTKEVAAVVAEKATTVAKATKEKAGEIKEYIASKLESAEDTAEEAAEEVEDAADEDWTGELKDAAEDAAEDVTEKVDEIAADMTDAVDPD